MAVTFMNSTSYCGIIPTIKITVYDTRPENGGMLSKSVKLDPNKLYDVVYYDDSLGAITTFTGKPRSAMLRADLMSSSLADLLSLGLPNVIEQVVFDYSKENDAHVLLCKVSNIRDITEHVEEEPETPVEPTDPTEPTDPSEP